ncbi:hypothetical protein CCP3SC15_5120001 [Gammaproteobacteria bacterium]
MQQATTLQLNKGTRLQVVVSRIESNPLQTDLFESHQEAWTQEMLNVALKMPTPFFFSELRMLAAHEPPHGAWWGILSRRLKRHGIIQTATFRRSPRQSRKRGYDFQYDRSRKNAE